MPLTSDQLEEFLGRLSAICADHAAADDYQAYAAPWDELIEEEFGLSELGSGASRTAYLVEVEGRSPAVLKVINGPDGIHEQRHELLCLLAGRSLSVVPAVYRWGPVDGWPCWMLVEYLDDAEEEDWEREAGVSFGTLQEALDECWPDDAEDPLAPPCVRKRLLAQGVHPPFAEGVEQAVRICRTDIAELAQDEHWGADVEGRLKIRDLGSRETAAEWAQEPSTELVEAKRRLLSW
jgi:hypothetical protein